MGSEPPRLQPLPRLHPRPDSSSRTPAQSPPCSIPSSPSPSAARIRAAPAPFRGSGVPPAYRRCGSSRGKDPPPARAFRSSAGSPRRRYASDGGLAVLRSRFVRTASTSLPSFHHLVSKIHRVLQFCKTSLHAHLFYQNSKSHISAPRLSAYVLLPCVADLCRLLRLSHPRRAVLYVLFLRQPLKIHRTIVCRDVVDVIYRF